MFGKKKRCVAPQYPSAEWGDEFVPPDQEHTRQELQDHQWPGQKSGQQAAYRRAEGASEASAVSAAGDAMTDSFHVGISDALAEVRDRLASLESVQSEQITDLTTRLEAKNRTLTAMNETVATSRRDQVAVLLTPAAKKLVDLEQQARHASLQQRESEGADHTDQSRRIAAEFDFFAEKVEEALEALGFERLACDPGTPFDARQHRAVQTAGTEEQHLDRTVAAVLRPGFAFAGSAKVAFPAKVIVNEYVYEKGFGQPESKEH